MRRDSWSTEGVTSSISGQSDGLSCNLEKKTVPIFTTISQVVLVVKNLPANAGDSRDMGSSTATHFCILAWRIPWTEDPGGLQSIVSHRVGPDWSNVARTHRK